MPKLDPIVVWLYIAICLVGLISIYSASASVDQGFSFSFKSVFGKQVIWCGICAVVILTIAFVNIAVIEFVGYGVWGLAIFLNILVLIAGKEINGAKSWFSFGGFSFQPGEFAKFAAALALAKWLGGYNIQFKGYKNIAITCAIFLIPMAFILLQNDTGSALVFLSFALVLYREGLPGWILVSAVWLGILAIIRVVFIIKGISVFWEIGPILVLSGILIYFFRKNKPLIFTTSAVAIVSIAFIFGMEYFYNHKLKAYQKSRIELVLGLREDKKNDGFNLKQSKIAIGAGKFWGRGFRQGTQTAMKFVPEQDTDFIFCTIGEEWGFVGVTVFFLLYFGLLLRLLNLAERQVTTFGRVLGYSVTAIIFTHVVINIGMTIGLLPTIGIPLPMVSAGGSSLLMFTLMIFTFLKVDEKRRG